MNNLLSFYLYAMKASIKIVTAAREFDEDQMRIMKRICIVLVQHNLSVDLRMKQSKTIPLKIKTA